MKEEFKMLGKEKEMEIWKTHSEFNWIQGSNLGRIKTIDRYVPCGNHKQFIKGHILKQYHTNSGYLFVQLSVNGKHINRLVHRLVAKIFLPNPDNLPEVNHKDCDQTNNNIDNLEWCDSSYNSQYREKYGVSQTEAQGHPLFAVELNTQEVLYFRSQREASRELNVDQSSITRVVKGKQKTVGSYWFVEVDDNAVDIVKDRFGNASANKVAELMNEKIVVNLK